MSNERPRRMSASAQRFEQVDPNPHTDNVGYA